MYELVCGIDEAGRGPIAGPVTAAAVILPASFPVDLLNDSKKITPRRREELANLIISEALDVGLGWAWAFEIDQLNIHYASLLAMERSLRELTIQPDAVLVDGLFRPECRYICTPIVRGDSKVASIMAASIIAKTARDKWMERYSWLDGRYNFEKHKGYPTAEHRALCMKHGFSAIHRKSFTIKI